MVEYNKNLFYVYGAIKMDFYNYNLNQEIEKIKNTKYIPYDLDFYSSRKIIHEVFDIPQKYNLRAYVYHGIDVTDFELNDYALLYEEPILVTRKKQQEYLVTKGLDANRIFSAGALFIRYKELKNIQQDKNAKGTIVFPSHSSQEVDVAVNWETYAQKLNKLPNEYKPINICMYYLDIIKGKHLPFINNGFNVYTAGHVNNPDFVDNFYEIIKHHKYTLTNAFGGSNLFYCINLGLKPFVYTGDTEIKYSEGENFKFFQKISGFNDLEELKKSEYTFTYKNFFKENLPIYPKTEISRENIKIFENKLGLSERTPDFIIKNALINYAKYGKTIVSLFDKLEYFIFKRSKIINKLKIIANIFLDFK